MRASMTTSPAEIVGSMVPVERRVWPVAEGERQRDRKDQRCRRHDQAQTMPLTIWRKIVGEAFEDI